MIVFCSKTYQTQQFSISFFLLRLQPHKIQLKLFSLLSRRGSINDIGITRTICHNIQASIRLWFLTQLMNSKSCIPTTLPSLVSKSWIPTQFSITLLSVQLSFCGSLKYNSEMLKNLHMRTWIQTQLPTPHSYIMKVHIVE